MNIIANLRSVFYDIKPVNGRDYEYSRKMSIFEGCTARAVFNLTSGAFLAGYASYLGADDSFNGVIGAMPVLAGIMSLLSPIYFEKRDKRKLEVVVLNFLHRFLLGLMVFIPIIVKGTGQRLTLLALTYFLAYAALSFNNPAASSILIDLTPEYMRGRYFSRRESWLLAVGIMFTLAMGKVMDVFRGAGNEYGGFVTTFTVVLLLSFANAFFWSNIKEPPGNRNKTTYSMRQIISMPLNNPVFLKIIIFFVLYNIGLQIGGPFFSVYMVTGLKLDYTFITIMGTISTIVNVVLVRVWGRIADSRSWNFVLEKSILLLGITHFSWSFVTGSTAYFLVPVLHMMGGASWSGIGISTFNIQFLYSPEQGRTVYTGLNAAVGGLAGFLGTLSGSALLGIFESLGIHISSFEVGGMQMLFCMSGILLSLSSFFAHFFIKPAAAQE